MVRGGVVLSLVLALGAGAAFAANAPAPTSSGPVQVRTPPVAGLSGSEPVSVGADNAALSENNREVVLSGNVVVKQGTLQLSADKVTAYYASNSGAPAQGSNITGNIDRLIAEGNVVVTRPGEVVKSASATYEMAKHEILMTGHVVATRGGNIVRGERVVVDIERQTVRLDMGAPGGRVQGLFVPSTTTKKP